MQKSFCLVIFTMGDIDPNDLNPTGLDSAFPDLYNKIVFIQFGALNRSGLNFEVGYISEFEIK